MLTESFPVSAALSILLMVLMQKHVNKPLVPIDQACTTGNCMIALIHSSCIPECPGPGLWPTSWHTATLLCG